MVKSNDCTIVMYHYVREIMNSAYPGIKGLELEHFKNQIEFFKKNYLIITIQELIGAIEDNIVLPSNSMLLTFDDGYLDHYKNVYPILKKEGIQGSFYAPYETAKQTKVLDVNKIHYLLAAVENIDSLVSEVFELLNDVRDEYKLDTNENLFNKLAVPNRFDVKEVIFIKRLLQVELDKGLRNNLTDILFKKYVSNDEVAFSKEIYASTEQLKEMSENGMHIGGHGYSHNWLGKMSLEDQRFEVKKSKELINEVTGSTNDWSMCFPYGSFNDDSLKLLEDEGCKLAFSTVVDVANINNNNRFCLPRLDTNDFPKK